MPFCVVCDAPCRDEACRYCADLVLCPGCESDRYLVRYTQEHASGGETSMAWCRRGCGTRFPVPERDLIDA